MLSLDSFKIKWIAIIGMALYHSIYVFHEIMPMYLILIFGAAGGLTFPIMGYFVVEGYKYTTNIKGYLMRLFIFGLIAVPFHLLLLGFGLRLNIMFSIILSLLTLMIYDKIKKKVIFWLLIFPAVLAISMIFMFDWIFIGVIVVLLYHLIRNETLRRVLPPIIGGILWFGMTAFSLSGIAMLETIPGSYEEIQAILDMWSGSVNFIIATQVMIIGCICAAVLLKGYNGERGKRMKWLFYSFYPLHLAILAIVGLALGLITLG